MNAITGSINSTKLFLQLRSTVDSDKSANADRKRSKTPVEPQPVTQKAASVRYQSIPPSLLARLHFRSDLENNPEFDVRI
jgi:hypothetical protein